MTNETFVIWNLWHNYLFWYVGKELNDFVHQCHICNFDHQFHKRKKENWIELNGDVKKNNLCEGNVFVSRRIWEECTVRLVIIKLTWKNKKTVSIQISFFPLSKKHMFRKYAHASEETETPVFTTLFQSTTKCRRKAINWWI